ncbi:Fic family protein [Enterococcus hirae]|uniref:Fic family protein n=1 Tax=Enterococcus TaxID=1350 RepID=UPI00032E3F82|nr:MULTISPECIES: Fic family protein [Enterococcus]EMF0039254.1 Fic family protein [Enterococcus hirae]EMF0080417.1 Fic family protein [Enterococcus hirae]EMF0146682.1 Fic family protein [Enterococcus hirae]EMF0150116.1 Fic family protein [Enterococcus hirae]EMF0185553.1 Fic family protein [Enterococcus hirae]
MEYQKLRILSYERGIDIDEEFKKRISSYTTISTDLEIIPFLNEQKVVEKKFQLFYLPLQRISNKAEKIKYNSDDLRKLSERLPGVAETKIFLSTMINEVQSTNETEGVESTKYEIGKAIINRNDKTSKKEKRRFEGIVNMYLNLNEKKFEFINESKDFRNIYDALFEGESDIGDWPDGKIFRHDQVELKDNDKIIHRGLTTESDILTACEKLIAFMNNKKIPYLEKCFISHYYFEYIHPFYDGNGRMGRFLISSYLARKLDPYTGLSVSNAVNNNKPKYYKAFEEVSHPRNMGEMTHFIDDMMDLIISGQEKSLSDLKEADIKMKFVSHYLKEMTDANDEQKKVLFVLIQDYLFSMFGSMDDEEVSIAVNLSRYKLNIILHQLVELGLIEKIKKSPSKHKISAKIIEDIS